MRENIVMAGADWHTKTGGYANHMTLRDHFAVVAMQALISADQQTTHDYVAIDAYSYADAMLKERAK